MKRVARADSALFSACLKEAHARLEATAKQSPNADITLGREILEELKALLSSGAGGRREAVYP